MSSTQVSAARKRLEMTLEQLAEVLDVPTAEVMAWEAGRRDVPRRHARMLEWLLESAEQDAAMERSGLPECEWVAGWEARPDHDYNALAAHVKACPDCQARTRWAEENLPPLPRPPEHGGMRVVGLVFALFERLPPWLHPAAFGALLLGGIMLVRMLVTTAGALLAGRGIPDGAAVALLAAMGAGAAGGLAYSATRPTLKKLGAVGDYLTGVVCIYAYLGSFFLAAPYMVEEPPIVEDPFEWILIAVGALFFGLLMGHLWFRKESEADVAGSDAAPGR